MRPEINRSMFFPWLAIAGLLLFLFFFPFPQHNAFWVLLQDIGHLPLFAGISFFLLSVFSHAFKRHRTSRRLVYFSSFLSTLLIAAMVEAVQGFIPNREASFSDFNLGAVGSLCVLLGFSLFDNTLNLTTTLLRKFYISIILFGLLAISTLPLLALTTNYIQKQIAFPILLTFEESWPKAFLSIHKNEKLPSESLQQTSNTPPGFLRFLPDANARWPFIRLNEVVTDWRRFRNIQFNFISNAREPMPVTILLDDQHDHLPEQHSQRYYRELMPGFNRIILPIKAPLYSSKPMDLEHMSRIWVAFPSPRPAGEVLIGKIQLQ